MTDNLWNEFPHDHEYSKNTQTLQNHVLEQYKIYVEMADRVSARRNLANVFFLSLHTTILGAVGFAFQKIELIEPAWLVWLPLGGVIIMCYVWWFLLQSYRQLNTTKYQVVGQLEERLPASPYWVAEWKKLGEGKDPSLYVPLTNLEKFIPLVFGLLYTLLGVYLTFFHHR